MSKVSNTNSTYFLSSSNQPIKSNWNSFQNLQDTFPIIYNKISYFQKDNSNMLKNTLLNNYISNSPPKAKMAEPESKYIYLLILYILYSVINIIKKNFLKKSLK